MEWFTTVIYLLGATIRVSTPLIFCAMAGLISERSGVIDIGLEGKMLAAAFAAAVVAALTGSAWEGLAAAVVVGAMLSLLHALPASPIAATRWSPVSPSTSSFRA